MNNKTFGRIGEDAVIAFMKKQGYHIVTANYNTGYGELDIVAVRRGVLVFTEVKTRRNERYGPISQELTWKKQSVMRRAAYYFRQWDGRNHEVPFYLIGGKYFRYARKYKKYRYDFAEVILGDGAQRIVYIKDAF